MYREKNKNSEICPINIVNKQDKGKEMPVTLDLLPRTYLWCTCGMSKNQPFCDGSHAKTEFKPLKFTIPEKMQGRKKGSNTWAKKI